MSGRRLPFALCIGFALLGAVLLIAGPDSDTRVVGAISILFFGVGGLALALPLLSREGAAAVKIVDVGSERGFLLPVARAKQLVLVAAAGGMTAAGVLIALSASLIVGLVCAITFGAFLAIGLVQLGGARGLALTPTRVRLLGWGDAELDWDAVEGAGVITLSRSRILGISATDPRRVRRRGWRVVSAINRRLAIADLVLPADQLAGDAERAADLVNTYLRDPFRRARIGEPDELRRVSG
ncbi:hypothetical protein [Solirubrobacter soli]|uniref:hypothetical protein n=1 Tax=Solirubrobacter soli TaxID=363832 RepID=UPI0004102E35|nr:hypothetical protein [Solirubrobacter soli]